MISIDRIKELQALLLKAEQAQFDNDPRKTDTIDLREALTELLQLRIGNIND